MYPDTTLAPIGRRGLSPRKVRLAVRCRSACDARVGRAKLSALISVRTRHRRTTMPAESARLSRGKVYRASLAGRSLVRSARPERVEAGNEPAAMGVESELSAADQLIADSVRIATVGDNRTDDGATMRSFELTLLALEPPPPRIEPIRPLQHPSMLVLRSSSSSKLPVDGVNAPVSSSVRNASATSESITSCRSRSRDPRAWSLAPA